MPPTHSLTLTAGPQVQLPRLLSPSFIPEGQSPNIPELNQPGPAPQRAADASGLALWKPPAGLRAFL